MRVAFVLMLLFATLFASSEEDLQKIETLTSDLKSISSKLAKNESVWIKSYESHIASSRVFKNLESVQKRIKELTSIKNRSRMQNDELSSLRAKERVLSEEAKRLEDRDASPFEALLSPSEIEEAPTISNPIDIFIGLSYEKGITQALSEYLQKKDELGELVGVLREQVEIYNNIADLNSSMLKDEFELKLAQYESFESAYETMVVSTEIYEKRIDVLRAKVGKNIEAQVYKLGKIALSIILILLIYALLKFIFKRYIKDNEKFYTANKIITFINVTLIISILFFSYIENVSYLVTILGFASAGIAIAMKDWFMSLLGWLVIVFGGNFKVGDRIRVTMDGNSYVGDIMDVSLLRIALLEDVTLTTVDETRRAGRVVLVPNNFVFTKLIANYSHSSLKTVWDGIDIVITFESNHNKAIHIVKEIAKKYSKGYMDITRLQLNRLRRYYNLRNTNVDPRVFSLIVPNGVKISIWYLTNSYATLALRSTISLEIVEAFLQEDDITIAYPTQMLHLEKSLKSHSSNPPKEVDL
ncbi:MAG: mechanosensitive ion channel domain-containing protein [Sulfuricurvum sp.]